MTAHEQIALDAMRDAIASGWTTEALMTDAAKQALIIKGVAEDTAATVARMVYNTHYRIMGAN